MKDKLTQNEGREMRTMKLSETTNMMRIIAEAKLRTAKEYVCLVDGEKVKVVK